MELSINTHNIFLYALIIFPSGFEYVILSVSEQWIIWRVHQDRNQWKWRDIFIPHAMNNEWFLVIYVNLNNQAEYYHALHNLCQQFCHF